MAEIKIKVGAAADTSLGNVFKPLIQAAKDARAQVAKEFARLQKDMGASLVGAASASRKALKTTQADAAGATKAISTDTERGAKSRVSSFEWSTKAIERAMKREWSTYGSEQKKALREAEKAQAAHARTIEKFAERTSYRATRFLMPNAPIASMAHRAANGIVQGLGIDTSLSGSVSRTVGAQSAAIRLSNRGHIEGAAGPNGQVVSAATLQSEARSIGKATAVNPEEILNAQTAMVGLTGDLQLARQIAPKVVALTAAIGGNQEEAAKAAGEFAAHLGDVPDKANKVATLMRIAAGQGKIGAVDFSDFAKYAAKAAAAAPLYAGDAAGNTAKLTALAEIAKMHGGANSPATAFTSIASLTNTLSKPARFKSIAKLIDDPNGQFTDSSHTKFKDPYELIEKMIVGSKGNITTLGAAVGDARSLTAIRGLLATFNGATGGKTDKASMQRGLEAMNEELRKFQGAIMSDAEVERANAERMKSAAAKAELFQQSLDQVIAKMLTGVLPAFERLEPKILEIVDAFSGVITWASNNTGQAVVAAIGLSIARAGLESTLRYGIESVFKGAAGQGALGGVGLLGNFAAGLTIATTAVAAFQAGMIAINEEIKKREAQQNKDALGNAEAGVVEARIRRGEGTPQDLEALKAIQESTRKRVEAAEAQKRADEATNASADNDKNETAAMRAQRKKDGLSASGGGQIGQLWDAIFHPEKTAARNDAGHESELKRELQENNRLLAAINAGILKLGGSGGGQPGVATGGKQGPH